MITEVSTGLFKPEKEKNKKQKGLDREKTKVM